MTKTRDTRYPQLHEMGRAWYSFRVVFQWLCAPKRLTHTPAVPHGYHFFVGTVYRYSIGTVPEKSTAMVALVAYRLFIFNVLISAFRQLLPGWAITDVWSERARHTIELAS